MKKRPQVSRTRPNDIRLRISSGTPPATLDVTYFERNAARYSRCDRNRAERRPDLSVAISFRLSSEFHCARSDTIYHNSKPTTQNPQLKTQNPQLKTQNPQLKTHNSKPTTHNSQLTTHNSQLTTQNPQLKTHTSTTLSIREKPYSSHFF